MNVISDLFKALGDETRLRIMAMLLDGNEYCVCDLMEGLAMPQSTVSRHLAYLKNNGWVDGRRQNKWMYYRLRKGNSDLRHDIIAALETALPQSKQAGEDRQRLLRYLSTKKVSACSQRVDCTE